MIEEDALEQAAAKPMKEAVETLDILRNGLRNEIATGLAKKKRKTNGEHRLTVSARCYWHLDKFDNPELIFNGQPIARLLAEGVRLYFPASCPQKTLQNRIDKFVTSHYNWGVSWDRQAKVYGMAKFTVKEEYAFGRTWVRRNYNQDTFRECENNMVLPL